MKAAPDVTNIVAACGVDGRQEQLESMLQQLELCEKALQVGRCVAAGPRRPPLCAVICPSRLPCWLATRRTT